MKLHFKLLAVIITIFNLIGGSTCEDDFSINQSLSSKSVSVQPITPEMQDAKNMQAFKNSCWKVWDSALQVGFKGFVRSFRNGLDGLLSDQNLDYAGTKFRKIYSFYNNVCNTVPEWALWTTAGFFVDSFTLELFCKSQLGALVLGGLTCYGASRLSQFTKSENEETTRQTVLVSLLSKFFK